MGINILHRMILKELVKVFVLALIGLTGLFLLGGLIQEASQRGLSPSQILLVIPLLIPNTLPYTIPATTLFATCVVYGRLAADNEVVAIKAAGVNPILLLKPALMLGIATSSLTMTLYMELIPKTQQLLRSKIMDDVEDVMYNVLKKEKRMIFPDFPYAMFVKEVQGRRLMDVIFKRRVKVNGVFVGYDLVAQAREARLRLAPESDSIQLDMDRCVVYSGDKNVVGNFTHRSFPFPLPPTLFQKENKNRTSALTWDELHVRQHELDSEKLDFQRQLAEAQTELLSPSIPEGRRAELTVHSFHLTNKIKDSERQRRNMDLEVQMRPALSFGCICFVLIGCPVGIWASRADFLSTFVKCFLPIVFVYYPLLLCGSNLARDGKVPAFVAVWFANGFLGIWASFLIWRLVRR